MASVEDKEMITSTPKKRGRPKTPKVSQSGPDFTPTRKSARVAKMVEEGKTRKINYSGNYWSAEDETDKAVAGMFKKITKEELKERELNEDDFEDDEEEDEEGTDEEDDLFQDEDKDVYDFDQQSSIISSQHANGASRWIMNKQKQRAAVKQMSNLESHASSSWGSNIYSYLATVLNSRSDLDLYSQFLKKPVINRSLDLTINDLCKPSKFTQFEGPSATLQNYMTKLQDDDAIVGLMKEIMSDKYCNSAHRVNYFVFVVKQPINGLRYYPKFERIFNEIDAKIVSESAYIVDVEKSKKSAAVIDTLVVSDSLFEYINKRVLVDECADLQRLVLGIDENRSIFGLFFLDDWNRAGVPYDKINAYKTSVSTAASAMSGNVDISDMQNIDNPSSTMHSDVSQNNMPNMSDSFHNLEFVDGFFVRLGSKKESLHLIARIESKYAVFNVVSEYNYAFKKHGLPINCPIEIEGTHSTYSDVLGDEKSLLVIPDQLYKSFIKTLNKETNVQVGKFKKNVLLDKETRHLLNIYVDTDVTMDMIMQDTKNDSNLTDANCKKKSLTLAFLNNNLVGFEIDMTKCITKCYQLLSDSDDKDTSQISVIQTTHMSKISLPVTLQFCNTETHENTVVSAYFYDNLSYSKRHDQIEKLIYYLCEKIYELPFQLSLFDCIFRMYQYAVSLTLNKSVVMSNGVEFATPSASVNCIFCNREFKAPSVAFDHEIRHLGLIKFKCQKHQMMFNDIKSYKMHRDEFIDCDGESENETELETQKLLNISSLITECPQCEKCMDYFPQNDMLQQHLEVCDHVSFSTRTPLDNKTHLAAVTISSADIDENVTGANVGQLICGVCGLSYGKFELMCAHMASHLNCTVCKVRLSSIDEVSVHLRDHMLKNDSVSGPGRKKIFVCDICNDFYGHKNNYYYHQWNEHGVVHPPIKNEDTGGAGGAGGGLDNEQIIKRRSKRVDELSYIATGSKKFNCKFCGTEVKVSGRDYVKHLDLKHGLTVEMECLCRICADIFETPEKLSDHLRSHHIQSGEFINAGIQSIFSCDKCIFFGHFRGVLAHCKTVHCDPNPCLYECPKCPARMADRRLWRLHLEKHDEVQNFTCKTCDTLFKSQAALRLHMLTYHGDSENEFKCKVCGNVERNGDELAQHMSSIHGDLLKDQEFLHDSLMDISEAGAGDGSRVKFEESLTAGTSTQRSDADLGADVDGGIQCDVCEKLLKTDRAYELHRMKHFRTRIFQCTECQATFRSKLAMRRHIRVDHLNLEPERYECQICGKIVTQISMHMLIHKSARYQCEFCGKRFTKSAYYNEHVRIHTNEKPYECHICNRRFNKKSNLNVHIGFHEKHRDDYGNYLEIKPRGRGHPSYDPMKTLAKKQSQKKYEVACGPDKPGSVSCIHDDMEYKWNRVRNNTKSCGTSDDFILGMTSLLPHSSAASSVVSGNAISSTGNIANSFMLAHPIGTTIPTTQPQFIHTGHQQMEVAQVPLTHLLQAQAANQVQQSGNTTTQLMTTGTHQSLMPASVTVSLAIAPQAQAHFNPNQPQQQSQSLVQQQQQQQQMF